jgi:uncharacterized protein YdiU (UPF0061 family)
MIEQFEQYRVKSISQAGLPIFTDENEHMVDALNLSLLLFEQKYGELFKNVMSTRMLGLNEIRKHDRILTRDNYKEEPKKEIIPLRNGYIELTRNDVKNSFGRSNTRNNKMPLRRNF